MVCPEPIAQAVRQPRRARSWNDESGVAVIERTHEYLLGLVAEGDRDAFERLYERFARPVFTLCVRALGDRGRAEDASQEAFASIWRAAASFDPSRGNASAWIFAVARNAATDIARRRVPRPTDTAPDSVDPAPLPEDGVIASSQAFRVHVAVNGLPPSEREVIELAYFGGLSQSEIAERLSTPLGTVKTRTRSALRRLAAELGGEL
jgi:RNA polymerase sigma-70 factor (ECF subfamily)